MTDGELDEIIKITNSIEKWQKTPDTPEALSTIPMISVSDIGALPEKYESEQSEIDGVMTVFTKSNSRGIVYTTLLFDISDFDERELFLVSVLSELYKYVATSSYSAIDLQTKIKTEIGGFNTATLVAT